MKLEQYTKAQSGQGIRELTHEFFEYHQNYIQKVAHPSAEGQCCRCFTCSVARS